MFRRSYILLVLVVVFSASAAFGQAGHDFNMSMSQRYRLLIEPMTETTLKNNVDSLRSLASQALQKGDYKTMLGYAQKMNEIGADLKDDEALLSSYIFFLHHSLAVADYSSIDSYFDKALELAQKTGNQAALVNIYSDMGIYAVNVEMDYYKGLYYFIEGLKLAEQIGDERGSIILMCNMAITYILREDPIGLDYALKVYEYGHRTGNNYMVFMGAYISTQAYFLLEDYDNALKYIEEAVSLVDEYRDSTGVYILYASVLMALGREGEVEQYYLKALDYAEDGEAISVVNAYLDYGCYLIGKGRYEEAVVVLDEGIRISREKNNPVYRYKLYQSISKAKRLLGDYRGALDSYVLFHEEADSAFNIAKERSVNQLKIQYESEKKEREIQEAKLAILKGEQRLQISILIIVIVFTALGAIYVLYRRQNNNYLTIVKQNHDALLKEQWYRARLAELTGNQDDKANIGSGKYSVSSLGDEKGRKLFVELDDLMRREHLYRKKDLTREGVANMLSTNRTYLSQVINEHTGLSFNYYVHSFRVEEAVRILSDPNNDIPLKVLADDLGFSALSTFYKIFQTTTGMPPSKFRKNVKAGNA